MSAGSCMHEDTVLAAVREGEWSADLRAHVNGCPACAEVALVGAALLAEARALEDAEPLPDPGRIWLEAQLRARRLAVQRAARPVSVVRCVAAACGVAVAVGAGVWLAPHFAPWLRLLRPPSADLVSGLAFYNALLIAAMSGVFLVVAVYALVTTLRES